MERELEPKRELEREPKREPGPEPGPELERERERKREPKLELEREPKRELERELEREPKRELELERVTLACHVVPAVITIMPPYEVLQPPSVSCEAGLRGHTGPRTKMATHTGLSDMGIPIH